MIPAPTSSISPHRFFSTDNKETPRCNIPPTLSRAWLAHWPSLWQPAAPSRKPAPPAPGRPSTPTRANNGGTFTGKVSKILVPGDENKTCTKCTDDRKDQPIKGLTILTGLKPNGNNNWDGGQILDPENGKVYSAKMSLSEDGQKLNVRGFLGISLLGRTQTWVREQ